MCIMLKWLKITNKKAQQIIQNNIFENKKSQTILSLSIQLTSRSCRFYNKQLLCLYCSPQILIKRL